MAEAIGLTASLITLMTVAYTSCKTLHVTYSSIRGAPKQIQRISYDLDQFSYAAEAPSWLLDHEGSIPEAFDASRFVGLEKALLTSLSVFAELRAVLDAFKQSGPTSGMSKRKRLKWTFKEKEIVDLRETLNAQKLNLDLAFSCLHQFSVTKVSSCISRLEVDIKRQSDIVGRTESDLNEISRNTEQKLSDVKSEVEDLKALQLSAVLNPGDWDRVNLSTDYDYTLRRHLEGTDTDSIATPHPSMQISSMYHTARTHMIHEGDILQEAEESSEIVLIGPCHPYVSFRGEYEVDDSIYRYQYCRMTEPDDRSSSQHLRLVINSHDSVRDVKIFLAKATLILNDRFPLQWEGKILCDDGSLRDYDIPRKAYLTYTYDNQCSHTTRCWCDRHDISADRGDLIALASITSTYVEGLWTEGRKMYRISGAPGDLSTAQVTSSASLEEAVIKYQADIEDKGKQSTA